MQWVDRTEQLAGVVEAIGGGPLAMDTEADSFHHFREKICLIQLSFGSSDVLLDPLAKIDLAPLAAPLSDPAVTTVLHGADYDLRLLDKGGALKVRGLFDTMIAARLVGESSFGLSSLLERHAGVLLDKRFQRADWSQRPLTEEMKRYAVLDTRHLLDLAELLRGRLQALGRLEWAEEEFGRLEQVRWGGERDATEAWLRVKGVRKLPRDRLALLRELAVLREERARERDRPLFRVLRDEVLLDLARRAPVSDRELEAVRGLPRSWRGGEAARALLSAVRRAGELPPDAWPEFPAPAPRRASDPALVDRVRQLRDLRDALAGRLGLEPSMVAPRALLEKLARAEIDGTSPAELPELRRWQLQLLKPLIA